MGHSKTQSSVKMKSLLVLAAVSAVALADEEAKPAVLPFGYGYAGLGYAGLGYHGLGYAGLGYPAAVGPAITYTPHHINYVPKEVEIHVKTIEYAVAETGCKNVFGFEVPCLAEGEARRKRSADEEAAAPAAVLPLGYAGLGYGYAGLGYAGLGYAGLGYHGLGYGLPAVTYAEPKVTDVEVPTYVYKPVVEKVNFAPACHNGAGFPVPC